MFHYKQRTFLYLTLDSRDIIFAFKYGTTLLISFKLNNRNKNQIFTLSPLFQYPDQRSYPPVLWTGGCELLRQDHEHSHQADQQGVRLPLLLCPL